MPADDYKRVLAPGGAIYLTTVGYGTGALLGRGIKRVREVHWLDELGIAQAMWLFDVENFGPFIVESDLEGNSLFAQRRDDQRGHRTALRRAEAARAASLRRNRRPQGRSDVAAARQRQAVNTWIGKTRQ